MRGAGSGVSSEAATVSSEAVTADEWFACLDVNKDALITADEMRTYLAAAKDCAAVLTAIGVETVDEAVTVIFECADSNKDGTISIKEFRSGFGPLKMRGQLCLAPIHGLMPHDFFKLWHEKVMVHLHGTREWAFAEIQEWVDAPDVAQAFWLMGGGGTGKSVLTAELLHRIFHRVAAWHFCRHDNPQQSAPSSLLRSLAAMLVHRLPGYAAALGEAVPAETVTEPKELFAALFEVPLKAVAAPATPFLLIIDALDELPRESQKSLLGVIAGQLSQLPSWLRLFTTSREEPQVKAALSKFTPKELRADEAKNRADVAHALRSSAKRYVVSDVSMADLEADVKRQFGISVDMAELQEPMDSSRETYRKVTRDLAALDGFSELLNIAELRPDPKQQSDNFEVVYAYAQEAQDILTAAVAAEWQVDEAHPTIRHAVAGSGKVAWVEHADDPGVKGEVRSKQKMANDYDGHANRLKDLARLTLRFTAPAKMYQAIKGLKDLGFKIVVLKNKYANPTPMGYSDFNLVVEVTLANGSSYLCEVQLNLQQMLDAKHAAHEQYEKIRQRLPELCNGTGVDAGKLESFIGGRLNNSSLDAAVAALSAKADGLFLYSFLLAQHLESTAEKGTKVDFAALDALPAGLGEVYAVNFMRAFPSGRDDPGWAEARSLVELIAAAREPISLTMAATLLEWDDAKQGRVLQVS